MELSSLCSSAFLDRFQVDLIDMRQFQRRDINSVMMNYIVTAKDHFSGIVFLEAISRKTPSHVVH